VPLEGFDANVFPLAKRLEGVEVKELAPGQVKRWSVAIHAEGH
jgi:hypothetical protein